LQYQLRMPIGDLYFWRIFGHLFVQAVHTLIARTYAGYGTCFSVHTCQFVCCLLDCIVTVLHSTASHHNLLNPQCTSSLPTPSSPAAAAAVQPRAHLWLHVSLPQHAGASGGNHR
jgi:hypothetical protein